MEIVRLKKYSHMKFYYGRLWNVFNLENKGG